jgi:hypothetical protein
LRLLILDRLCLTRTTMWTALAGTLEKMQKQHHLHQRRHPYQHNLHQPSSSCGPFPVVMSIPRRRRRVLQALVVAQILLFVVIVLPLASLQDGSSAAVTSRRERIGRKMHQLKAFFDPTDSHVDSSSSDVAQIQVDEEEGAEASAAAAATELLTVDSLPDVPRRRLSSQGGGQIFAPIQAGDASTNANANNNINSKAANQDDTTSGSNNKNNSGWSNSNNDALSLSLMLSMWTDQKEEHSLLVRLAVQRALLDILCQSNEVVVLSFPGGAAAASTDDQQSTGATNVCLAGGYRHLTVSSEMQQQMHRVVAWEDASANGYYTVVDSSATVRPRDEQVSYISYQVWTVNYPVLNMGALYKNQVSTNQQYLASSSGANGTIPTADDVVASDSAIQMAALQIFAAEIQRKLDGLLLSGSFDATMQQYAPNATAYASVVGNEYDTFSKVVPAPVNPVSAFFSKTFDEWTWDPIHVACVVLLGSLVVGMTVLVCLLCRRRRLKVVYTNQNGPRGGGAVLEKNYHSGSSTGNDETLSVGFPDVLALGTGSVRKMKGSDDGSVQSLYAMSLPPNDNTSLAQSDSRMEEGLPASDVFDPAVYAYLDAEQHYAQASAVDENDLRGGWGSCLIPLPGSLRKKKSSASNTSSSPKRSSAGKAAVEGGTGILRPPSYATSGPVDVDQARNNQAALEEDDDNQDEEDRNGWSSSSSSTSEGVTLAYETDLDATVEMDVDTGYRLNKRMKKVAFKYVETNRSMRPDRRGFGGEGDIDIDDGLISDLDDEGSFCSLYGGAANLRETSSSVIRRKSGTGTDAAATKKEGGASVPVDIDSLLTADQVGMMPTEIGTCATLGLSTEGDDKAAEITGTQPSPAVDANTAPRPTLGQSVRRAASILGLKS